MTVSDAAYPVVAVCVGCHTVRFRSRGSLKPKTAIKGEDFEPVPPQAAAVDGTAPTCSDCGSRLQFTFDQDGKFSKSLELAPPPRHPGAGEGSVPEPRVVEAVSVTALFAAQEGEEVRDMRELGFDRWLVVTSRRILVVDIGGWLVQHSR